MSNTVLLLTDDSDVSTAEALLPPVKASRAPRTPKHSPIEGALLLRRLREDAFQWTVRKPDGSLVCPLEVIGKWNDGTKAKLVAALDRLGSTFEEGQVFTYHGEHIPAIRIVEGTPVVVG